jgi:hypothetical protein
MSKRLPPDGICEIIATTVMISIVSDPFAAELVSSKLRFHVGNSYYFSAGVEVPVTGPKNESFTWSPIFWLTKVW